MASITRRIALTMGAAATAVFITGSAAQAEEVVHVYNWVDYIGETTLADFTKATGIKVVYDTYDAAETEEAKLLAGSSGYDVVLHSGSSLPKFIQAGAFQKIDRSKLTNYDNQDAGILKTVENWDPGNAYTVVYMWGTTGITYNLDMIKERLGDNAPMGTLDILLKPELAAKVADCGISVLESPRDVIPMVLSYLGKDPNTEDPADYDAVVEAFKPVRQYIKTFDASNYLNAIPNKELCVINNWSGDYATATSRASDAGVEINLSYEVPATGSPAWFDVWAIPKDSKNVENAHKFLNFMLDAKVIAGATNFTYYANANSKANEFVLKEILDDPAIYPNDEVKKRLWTSKSLSPKAQRALTRAWTKIKTGS